MKSLQKTCEFSPEPVGRVDRVVQQLTGLSRAGVRGLFDHGCVQVNGSPCTDSATRAANGDVVEVQHNPHRRYKEVPTIKADSAFDILFEDEHLIVVNKAAHMLTVPTTGGGGGAAGDEVGKTLVHALQRHINRGGKGAGAKRVYIVHRLDRGTSGVLVFGKTQKIASLLKAQFAARKPERIYLAIVAGELANPKGTFNSYLGTDMALNRFSTKDTKKGQLAITHYEVANPPLPLREEGLGVRGETRGHRDTPGKTSRNHGKDTEGDASLVARRSSFVAWHTLVRVQLETGRRNQIRVHFAEAGNPVLGDPRYRPDLAQTHPKWKHKRLALHAMSLELTHPVTGEVMKFEAKVPDEFGPLVRSMPRGVLQARESKEEKNIPLEQVAAELGIRRPKPRSHKGKNRQRKS